MKVRRDQQREYKRAVFQPDRDGKSPDRQHDEHRQQGNQFEYYFVTYAIIV